MSIILRKYLKNYFNKRFKIIFVLPTIKFMKKYLVYLFVFSFLTSCISNKDLIYFQGDPVKKEDIYRLSNEPYRLQVNDVLFIDIKAQSPELVALFKNSSSSAEGGLYFSGYTVDRHGNIRIPKMGELNVLGYTVREVQEKIEAELPKYLIKMEDIFVTVKLAGISFIVTGEVGSPGTKSLMQNQVSIVDALANAGEITILGNRKNVLLIRNSLDGVKKYSLDMTDISIFDSEHFYIQPNDIIYVTPLKQKSWGTGTNGLQTFSTIVTAFSFIISTVLLIKNI